MSDVDSTPNLLTGGSVSVLPVDNSGFGALPARFDWYQGTLPEDSRMSAVEAFAVLGDEPVEPVQGRHGYDRGYEIRRGGCRLMTVYEGRGRRDHFVATGADAPEVARFARRRLGGHSVSRADVCVDFGGGRGFFEHTRGSILGLLGSRVSNRDWIERSAAGESRTFYVGARTSEVVLRLYEKGRQDSAYEPDTIRLEVQVRPASAERKAVLGTLEPAAVWGFARWSRKVLEAVAGLGVPAVPARLERVSDLDVALDAMVSQWGGRLAELAARHEGDAAACWLDLWGRRL